MWQQNSNKGGWTSLDTRKPPRSTLVAVTPTPLTPIETVVQGWSKAACLSSAAAPLACLVHVPAGLLLLAQLEVLGALDDELLLGLALLALQAQRHLLGGLGLWVVVSDGD